MKNEARVIEFLKERGPSTSRQASEAIGIPMPTATALMSRLCLYGVAIKIGKVQQAASRPGGRPLFIYRLKDVPN